MSFTTHNQTSGLQPPPRPHSRITHPLPRRSSHANSVTLRHHRRARDACPRANATSTAFQCNNVPLSPRRNSSGDSHETGQSDPKHWFDQSNQNPIAMYDTDANAMDVDPPFFQKESSSSNEDKVDSFPVLRAQTKLTAAHSSSADDYRSVIDDLTIEIQKLKDELKRYKQQGPDLLRKDKLFEIKIHGLPKCKKRELEATLREFAASLGDSPETSSTQKQGNNNKHANRDYMYSEAGPASKHASSSSGSNARPLDSAYASMSTGAHSSGPSLSHPPQSSRKKSAERKVENYLRDIPEGLYPRHMSMTEKERKKLVVRRLEQLFTGKLGGRYMTRNQALAPTSAGASTVPVVQVSSSTCPLAPQLPPSAPMEASREAKIFSTDQQSGPSGKNDSSRNVASAANSNEEQPDVAGNGANTNAGPNKSLPMVPPPAEQRPTSLKDLDPNRTQVPSENMEYIRHLGLVAPEMPAKAQTEMDVCTDAEGWVYLNLLCNLAQLHMINVTPGFVRSAVCEMSTKFQLSPDGRRIRWRGGNEGTRFSSDSSGDNSQRSADTDETTSSNNGTPHKRQKTANSIGVRSSSSGKNPYKFGPQVYKSSSGFYYKPLFAHHEMPPGQVSPQETLSSLGPADESNPDGSRWDNNGGSAMSPRRKRRHDGAIIYYSGAPFCTDLSGDPGDLSTATYMLSSGQEQPEETKPADARPRPHRSASGSSLCFRPLIDRPVVTCESRTEASDDSVDSGDTLPELFTDSGDDSGGPDIDLGWTGEQQYIDALSMEPCGLGGVLPEDHFMVVVTTKRSSVPAARKMAEMMSKPASRVIAKKASILPPMEKTSGSNDDSCVEIKYVSGRIKRLPPVSLPPPALFLPPFSSDGSSNGDETDSCDLDCDSEASEARISRKVNPHTSDGYPDGVDLSSGDEDGDDPEDEPVVNAMYDGGVGKGKLSQGRPDQDGGAGHSIASAEAAPGTHRGRSKSASDA